jgi:hypothetical protein
MLDCSGNDASPRAASRPEQQRSVSARAAEEVTASKAGVSPQENAGGGAQAVLLDRCSNGVRPAFSQSSVELLSAAMPHTSPSGSGQKPRLRIGGAMASVENPGDPEVLLMSHPASECPPGLPPIGQLIVGHARSVAQRNNSLRKTLPRLDLSRSERRSAACREGVTRVTLLRFRGVRTTRHRSSIGGRTPSRPRGGGATSPRVSSGIRR